MRSSAFCSKSAGTVNPQTLTRAFAIAPSKLRVLLLDLHRHFPEILLPAGK